MVSRAEKKRMQDFVIARFEDAERYNILESKVDHVLLAQKPEFVENPCKIYVFLHNSKISINEYNRLVRSHLEGRRLVSNVFYKDGVNFMVRLGERGKLKSDDRSLKNYSLMDVNKMIHLRDLERAVLEKQRESFLVYFQPETQRLSESVRGFSMDGVVLDYSHVDRSHRSYGFVENRGSIDYKIANEIFGCVQGGLRFRKNKNSSFVILDQVS